ncbi:protein of unknown function - conserved [Leishmania donovani]|uniref:Uncharacterized protein n=3 Tax=Leishmania donovani species complex TaxID=38574 RepID=A4HU76_LEIIN|nr:conserved hypothetical protein [Leishmania infantum JPCM5]CAC9455900.1 hypothetical_protein_-__conserved [Leishmania infantum]CAJ1986671.1 protein of unknown function - conserved [Leishmania donovani]CAM65983.1 conserved hypothetical protein [Leishmania infantum JPCM5]SUZ39614.1 hypothetical_protein_-__conserved [Leishmania infantum]VDZ42566.1 hypothetical_protein_conserved [Leishmania donovani]|eukprot:XP_001463617.1 conserved hypothetical protein [Leishmania infantum JPCM5]
MNAMYSADQINVPPELGTIMKQYTKAVMRDKPTDLYKYSANFFAILSGYAAPFDSEGQLMENGTQEASSRSADPISFGSEKDEKAGSQDPIDILLRRYDRTGTGYMDPAELPRLLAELRTNLSVDEKDVISAEDILAVLPSAQNQIDLLELRSLLLEGMGD